MTDKVNIPEIAITQEMNEWNSSSNNIADTLTDVEDLDESPKPKSKLKIKIKDEGAVTDVEDLEASDTETDFKVPTIAIENLNLDSCNFEENASTNDGIIIQSYLVKTRSSLNISPDGGITDVENLLTDEESNSDEIPEADINLNEYHSDYINISSGTKPITQNLQAPIAEVKEMTDVESLSSDEKEKLTKKFKTKKRRFRGCYKQKQTEDCPRMKKSSSHPLALQKQHTWAGFESDGDVEDKCPILKVQSDTEEEIYKNEKSLDIDSGDTEIEYIEGKVDDFDIKEVSLPAPVRNIVLLSENKTLIPSTKILPLDETVTLGLIYDEQPGGTTDTEYIPGEDDLLTVESYNRAPTPDVCLYEDSSIYYGEQQINATKEIKESLTDTEYVTAEHPKRFKKIKNKSSKLALTNELPLTDCEDFYMSDSNRKDEERSITPCFIKENRNAFISSKGPSGTTTTRHLLNVKMKQVSSPNVTDVEDLAASADEDDHSDRSTPKEFRRHLEQERSSKVYIESTNKINLDSPNEIMYLKGGSCYQNPTDVEEMSDDIEEWDASKKSASQEEAPQDAEQATSNYVTYESVLLRTDRDSTSLPSTNSYKEIDAMLEKMLVEVEKQETLFSLDLDVLEPEDNSSYTNTLEIVPETDAIIELPISNTQTYESCRQITVASNESLNDEDDGYEPIEYNALRHVYQRFDLYPEDVWFEGTYRNLSIVPEEDEDESVSLLSNYSNFYSHSTPSIQYSVQKDIDEDDSSDSSFDSDSESVDKKQSIVKAEVKLLVKTSDRGKEAIEIRSVREFVETPSEAAEPQIVKKKSQLGDKFSNFKNKLSSIVDRTRKFQFKANESESREDLLEVENKPSFTLPQVFTRLPESNLQESKRFGSRTELVTTSSERFPLDCDPAIDESVVQNVDLYANIPFYPCYKSGSTSQYGLKLLPSPHTDPFTETVTNPFNECDRIPTAYCDWLEVESGGISTTTERLVASNEETLLDKPLGQQLTGLSVIDDHLTTDLKTVTEKTNAFIQSESQPEPYDALAEKYTKKEPINEKKVDDNKNNMNEKKKAKKGFFGSIKTFVERSFESDSESEKSPKKSKKPKKEKKKKGKENEQGLPPRKPKLPTPPLEPSDIDSIPFAEASVSDLPPPYKPPDVPDKEPVTDLNATSKSEPEQKIQETTIAEEQTKEVEIDKLKPKDKEKDKKKVKGKTVIVEEVTKTIEPLVIEAEEFSIVVDPTKKESPKKSKETFTINIDETIDRKEKEILEKSPILTEEKIVKPIAVLQKDDEIPTRPPRARDHVYEDIEDPSSKPLVTMSPDQVKKLTTNLIQNEQNHKAWAEVSAKDIVEKQDKEVSKEKSKIDETDAKKEKKSGGFFGLFKRKDSKKDEETTEKMAEQKPTLSEQVIKDMEDSENFLSSEVEKYQDSILVEDVKENIEQPVSESEKSKQESEEQKQSEGFFGLFKKPKKEEKPVSEKKAKKDERKSEEKKVAVVLSEEVLRNILDSKRFLEGEIQNYDGAKEEKSKSKDQKSTILEKAPVKTKAAEKVQENLEKKIIDGKEEQHELRDQKATVLEETLVKEKVVEKAEKTPEKNIIAEKDEPSPKKKEQSPKPSPGLFGLFKKSKKEDDEVAKPSKILSEEVVEQMQETEQFLTAEVDNYHDVKPVIEIKEKQTVTETIPETTITEESKGFFGLFKKIKKEETQPEKPQLSESVIKDISDTKQFLSDEVQNYEDGKLVPEKLVEEEKVTESAEQPSSGFFGLFKKTKREDEKTAPEVKEVVVKETLEVKIEPSVTEAATKVTEEVKESSPKPGFFGLFKKSKKDDEETVPVKAPLSDSVVKQMEETNQFLSKEVENYEDVKPEKFDQIQEEKVAKSESSQKGLFGIFKRSKDEPETIIKEPEITEDESKIEVEKPIVMEETTKAKEDSVEASPKSSRGLFGIFKKSKKEEEETETKPTVSEVAQKTIDETKSFIKDEIEKYHDVKPEKQESVDKEKVVKSEEPEASPKTSRGIFSIFKKPKKDSEEDETKHTISESAQRAIDESETLLSVEVEHAEDVKPTKVKEIKDTIEVLVKETEIKQTNVKKEEQKTLLSETVKKEMEETEQFLGTEIENYHDVKPRKTSVGESVAKTETEIESSPKSSRGIFKIFKKIKTEEEKPTESKTVPEDTSVKISETKVKVLDGKREASPRPTSGIFDIFKKSSKEDTQTAVQFPDEVQKSIKDTQHFLEEEVEKYEDVKPYVVEETQQLQETEKQEVKEEPQGFLAKFKKVKKKPTSQDSQLSENTQRSVDETTHFISTEIENYEDVKLKSDKKIEKTVTFEETKSKLVQEGQLPQPESVHMIEVAKAEGSVSEKENEVGEVCEETTQTLEQTLTKDKEKPNKDKKGFFHMFGKKTKSQETSLDESRAKSEEEEAEVSPKKQKRRKSSSPFKFFDKMKKSEDEVKEEITEQEKPDDGIKEVKEELLAVELDTQPTMDLSEEVLSSLDKKMKELKMKYAPEVQKQINDCRDFLFIEVDNYDDGKPVVVTDIDSEISTDAAKTVDEVIDKAEQVVKETQKGAETLQEKVAEVSTQAKETSRKATKKAEKKSSGFFSMLGSLISGSVDEAKSDLKDIKKSAEKSKESAEKTLDAVTEATVTKVDETKQEVKGLKETLLGVAAKAGETITDLKKEATDKTLEVEEKVDKQINGIQEAGQKLVSDTKQNVGEKVDDAKERVEATKVEAKSTIDKGLEKIEDLKQTSSDLAAKKAGDLDKSTKDVKTAITQKADDISTKIGKSKEKLTEEVTQKLEAVKKSKDEASQKLEDVASKVDDLKKENVEKVEETIKDQKNKFVKANSDTEEIIAQKVDVLSKTKDTVEAATAQKIQDLSKSATKQVDNLEKAKQEFTVDIEQTKEKVQDAIFDKIQDIKQQTSEKVQKLEDVRKSTVESVDNKIRELKKTEKDIRGAVSTKTEEVKETISYKVDDLVNGTKKIESVTEKKLDEARKTKDEVKTAISDKLEEVTKTATEKVKKFEETKDIVKESVVQKVEDLTTKTLEKKDELTKMKETVLDSAAQKVQSTEEKTKTHFDLAKTTIDDLVQQTEAKTVDFLDGISKSHQEKSVEAKDKIKTDIKEKTKEMAEIKENVVSKIGDIAKDQTEVLKKTKESIVEIAAREVEDISRTATKSVVDLKKQKDVVTVSTKEAAKDLVKKIEDTNDQKLQKLKTTKDSKLEEWQKVKGDVFEDLSDLDKKVEELSKSVRDGVEKTEIDVNSKIDGLKKQTETKVEETKDKVQKTSQILDLDEQLAKLTTSLEELSETGDKMKSYVTSPARRSKSQKLPREEGPVFREVKTSHTDEESDEEQYIVTEPTEKRKPLFHIESEEDDSIEMKIKDRRDSVKSNVLETLSENKLDNLLSDLEVQLVQDLERSVTGEEKKSETKLSKAETELETIKKDSQADVDQIEKKLRDLDKALDSLERASDPKLEKKLHRVERKFERMASEVLEKESIGASPTEVEAHREHEFQKLVSQLSTEEVSDFQKEYSHLWDETTFSKSDEWDSKTPDSQVDVQELPQGEVVYMAPVTLNKDNLVNKAGIEVDVIPIKRSPSHSPRPTKKNKRAKSAMDFYEETSPPKEFFDRGSLPDLKRTVSSKGSLVSTIIQLNPDRFLYGSNASLRSTASSSSELSRGEIMNAVLDWLDKSVDSFSSESNLSPSPLPAIRITNGSSKKRAKRKGKSIGRETTCATTLTEDTKNIPQPKPRFAKEPPLQFREERPHKLEKQISPVRDDLLDEDEAPVPETYSDKKKFWESVTREKRMSLNEPLLEKDLSKKRASVHEVPIPKPRSQVQVSQSIEEAATEERIMTEYQASFQPPSDRKSKTPPKVESDKESTDSESDNVGQSAANENAGYISDSGDVEHYISDSEIEDRVPQIRERQMSVFAPPVAATRKTIYERSASLPTEDLYEVSARSIKLRKQYYEEQIKKEMIEEQLTSEIEEEPSPERKALLGSLVQQLSEEKKSVKDLVKSFDEATKKEVSFDETHKVEDEPLNAIDTQTKRSSLGSEQDSSSEVDRATRDGSTSKPDSMEVHVDKSEIEDSEKLAELDQDATDLETKSLDSLNAIEMSPKSSNFVDESVPEITVTLSGIQRRISEESDEYAPKHEKKELESPIHVPEEHVEDTVWEVSVQSQPEARFDEKVTSFDATTVEKIEKDDDLSIGTRDESDLGSEIHQDHSDSYSDKIKSESHSDIERIIMDSLQHQKVDPAEAKVIASALIGEIEAEIQRRECMPQSTTTGDVSDYLKYLAETKGLDEREVELVESVLARRQRELAKLSRGDTQASSIEITDEDLRYSGAELDSSHILEQQISQLKAEIHDDLKSMNFLDKIDEKHTEESHFSKDYETYKDDVTTGVKSEIHTKTSDSIKGEKSGTRDTILEEDETLSESVTQESEMSETRIEAIKTDTKYAKSDKKEMEESRETSVDVSKEKSVEITAKTTEVEGEDLSKKKTADTIHEKDVTKSIVKHHVDMSEKSPTEEVKLSGTITCEDYSAKEEATTKETASEVKHADGGRIEKEESKEKSHVRLIEKEMVDAKSEEKQTHKDEDIIVKQSKITSKLTSTDVIRESSTSTEVKEKIEVVDLEPGDIDEIKTVVQKHEEIRRTSSSESKSSIESGKSPEDQFSSCSSGRKGDSDSSKIAEKPEVHLRKAASLPRGDRKSGIDFEAYSSSGESHYHSFELDSGKSRPCSSDVEGLVAAGSSEYESALTSQDYSSRSHATSAEYHTAVSSLSSKESMKSLDSESSGHLGSVEVSELSETLVPSASDAEGDMLDAADQLDDGEWGDVVVEEQTDAQTKMKRSHEMTFQPEPKILTAESPQTEEIDKKFTSLDDGSVVSMSLSSTSGTEPKTVIELSRADSEKVEGGSMSVSGISDQLSIEGSCDSLVFHQPSTTSEMGTSTGQSESNLQIESITFTTSVVTESGIRSVSTQVTSESHSPEEDRVTALEETQMNGKCPPEIKKKTHRRQESTSSFVPSMLSGYDQKFHSDLTESDKYTAELSFKEETSDEKKDIDEREKEESYETEADQGFHRDIREGKYQETEEEIKDDTPELSSETQASVGELEQEYSSALARAQETKKKSESDLHIHKEQLEKRDSHGKSSSTSSEKSSFEEAEAEAAFNMVAHVSPAHKIKQICPILEDEDAEKHELETREKAQKEYEKRRREMRDQSPGSIPDIKVTQHMTPLVDRNFHYPDLELEEQERQKEKEKELERDSETQKSTPQTPSSKSSEDTDQGREYVLEDSGISIPEDATTESKSTVIEQTVKEEADKDTESPNSDSFEMLEKPDLIDDFVVIEEVAKEAQEFDSEGKSVSIQKNSTKKRVKKHDEEVEEYLAHSAPTPLTRMTDVKFYPDGSSSEELGFDFEDSPPINAEAVASNYEKELEANKKWIEQQFQGDQAARLAAGYDYEMEFERGPLEDIKEEDINDFDPTSSRIGSLGSQKESGGSLGSVKDSYSSTPEYDVLAGRKYFTRSGEHDDVSMSSLQEFENLERAMSLENKRCHQGSQDSSSNGSFKTRYFASKSGQGDDVSVSSLKEFEGLEMACIAAHKIEVKAKEEEAMLAQIDEGQESLASESESCETASRTDKKIIPDSDEEDYEKRMFEIDEIIKQAQSNVERFVDLKETEKTESLGRGDSIEEVAKVPDLDLDTPVVRSTIKVQWKENEDVMITSTDSIDGKVEDKGSHHDSTDSLDQKTAADIMTASTDSIEFQAKKTDSEPINLLSDSIEIKDEACGLISSDSLELGAKNIDNLLENTDSLVDPTSSTATHATYQYETDSVFSGSFTSGGSNTMVSSTDTIDPVQVDIAAAARKVWFDEDAESSHRFTTEYIQDNSKPYVTEVIEPSEEEGYSYTVHRKVELPPEIRKVTFRGSDVDERLKQFIEDFNEGEHVEEVQEVDAAGNVHTRRIVQKRFIIHEGESQAFDDIKKSVASKTNQLTSKEKTGEESGVAATGSQESGFKVSGLAHASRRRQLRYEISVEDQIEVDPREHDWRFNLPQHAEAEETASGGQFDRQQRPVADQHQLSEEMKQLLKELEKESKQ